MSSEELNELFKKGVEAAEKGYTHSAQVFLGQVAEQRNSAEVTTWLAWCQAKGQGRIPAAIKTCRDSIKRDPRNVVHYLILGRILVLNEDKGKAIDIFRQGLKITADPRIIEELKKMGTRKPAIIKSLKRSHPLNRFLGRTLSALGLR